MTKRSSKPRADAPAPASVVDEMSPGLAAETVIALAMQARIPVFVYSEPGAGKSVTVRSICDELKARLHTIMLSVREPTDQGGLPGVFEERGEKLVRIIPPGWARDLIAEKQGTVFFDEVSNATPATMNSALRIVQEGVVGDGEKLPEHTSFVLAGNTPETNVGANDLTAGIANRCVHVAWPFDFQRWRSGMLRGWAPEDRHVVRLPENWRDGIQPMRVLVVSFLDTRPGLAQKQPRSVEEQARAWPSGRTWDLTATLLAAAQAAGFGPKTVVGRMIVLGLVGAAAQTEWTSWVANMDLPSTQDVMADPDGFELPKRQDQMMAVLSGVVSYVASHRNDEDVYMRAWAVANRVLAIDPSMAVPSMRELGALMPPGADRKTGSPFHKGMILAKDHLRPAKVDYGSAS